MPVWGMPPVGVDEIAALEHDYRDADKRLVRQRSHIVLLAYEVESQAAIARAVRCSLDTVSRALERYRRGGRPALRRRLRLAPSGTKVTLAWQKALAEAMRRGPEACGVARPTWTAPLLAGYLAQQTGIAVSGDTVRRALARLDYVCRRPTWTVRHKAGEQPEYAPKRLGSTRS
jgi:transposase